MPKSRPRPQSAFTTSKVSEIEAPRKIKLIKDRSTDTILLRNVHEDEKMVKSKKRDQDRRVTVVGSSLRGLAVKYFTHYTHILYFFFHEFLLIEPTKYTSNFF